ncbi:MAG: hypothetical protein KGZ90_02480 [Algoriphagus sp.]|nr:hypothetical protein [Algoriphagus sp.]
MENRETSKDLPRELNGEPMKTFHPGIGKRQKEEIAYLPHFLGEVVVKTKNQLPFTGIKTYPTKRTDTYNLS